MRMSTVDATVPSEWLPAFIGHMVWAKPYDAPDGEPATWHKLVDVYVDMTVESWHGRRLTIDVDGDHRDAYMAKSSYIRGIPDTECQHRPDIAAQWYEWLPPFDDPPTPNFYQYADHISPELPPTLVEPEEWGQYNLF